MHVVLSKLNIIRSHYFFFAVVCFSLAVPRFYLHFTEKIQYIFLMNDKERPKNQTKLKNNENKSISKTGNGDKPTSPIAEGQSKASRVTKPPAMEADFSVLSPV